MKNSYEPRHLLEKGGWECANDILNWLNTLEDSKIKKSEVYKYVMNWRPDPYLYKRLNV